jgi:PAS domain S-box-containing protein
VAGRRLLVVEDEFIVAFEIQTTLEDRGFTVCGVVASGEDAVAAAERERPDCVLMDINIRGTMGGVEAARRIRERVGVPVAFLTGFPSRQVIDQARDIAPIAYFSKPFDFDEICAELERALGPGGGDGAEAPRMDSEWELAIHNRIAETFLTTPGDEMYESVLSAVLEALDSRHGIFGYIDPDGDLVVPSLTRDISDECRVTGESTVFPRSTWGGIWGEALENGQPVLSNSAGAVPAGHIPIDRAVFAPVIDRGKVIGLLGVANRDTEYTGRDRKVLETIARHVGPILQARLERDATEAERARVQAELSDSERRYRAVVELQSELVARFTRDGTLTFVNQALCEYSGMNRDALIGEKFQRFLTDEMVERTRRHLKKLTPETPAGENEIEWQAPDGSNRAIAWITHALYDDDGGFIEYQTVGRDVTDRRRAEEELRDALEQKEILLREVHHRVKNNMAVISSLLNLQSEGISDARALQVLQSMRDRIRTMALVHDQLYRSGEFASIDLGQYVTSVTDALYQAHSARADQVTIRTDIADVTVEIDDAIPCGLILSELISNAFKHAFPGDRRGEILVTLEKTPDGTVQLMVKDDGVGSPADDAIAARSGFGLEMVVLLVKQLGGSVEFSCREGMEAIVRFPGRTRASAGT